MQSPLDPRIARGDHELGAGSLPASGSRGDTSTRLIEEGLAENRFTRRRAARWKSRLGGALILLVSSGFIAWNWHCAVSKGYFYQKSALLFPATAVVGLGAVLFPDDAQLPAPGVSTYGLKALRFFPLRWRIMLLVGLALGGLNYWLLSR